MTSDFGVRRQSVASTALWIRSWLKQSKAVSRYACHRTPKSKYLMVGRRRVIHPVMYALALISTRLLLDTEGRPG